jgi:hypothetical protein
LPSSRSERIVDQAPRRAAGSKPVVGSSRKISSGSPTSASARSRRARVALLAQAGQLDHLIDVARVGIEMREMVEQLGDARVVVDAAALQHDPDSRAQLARTIVGVEPEDADLPGGALAVALEDLHGARLTGPVGTEQTINLTAPNRELDPPHRLEPPVALAQITDLNRRLHARHAGNHPKIKPTPRRRARGHAGD